MGAAAAPILIGSALGAATNSRNPLQGALLGGVLGGVGGSFMGGFGNAANTAATAASTTAGGVPAAITGVTPATTLPAQGVGTFATPTMPGVVSTNTSTGLIGSTTAPVTMAERFTGGMNALKSDIGALNTLASQNPVATQIGLGAARDIFSQQPQPPLQSGLLRGSQVTPQQPAQYAMAMPQINLLG